jgi:hypothetical protein
MSWGLGIGILIVLLMFVFFGFIIVKETMTHRFWRRKVDEGDLEMIRQLIVAEVQHWRAERPPKGMPAGVWQGIQGVEVVEIGRDYVRTSTSSEPQFALVGGVRKQVTSALDEAKRITAKLAERFFYDVPHVRLERVQIDCYTTFHEPGGAASQACILSTVAQRTAAAEIDWDNDPPDAIAEQLDAHYQVDARGDALPIEPEDEAVRVSKNGASGNGKVDAGHGVP